MKWISRVSLVAVISGFLFSCGGTGTGNPEASHSMNGRDECDPAPYVCSDDSLVYRNPSNLCEFDPCP